MIKVVKNSLYGEQIKGRKEQYIRVLVKEPGRSWEAKTVKNELKVFQDLVGGYIETVRVKDDRLFVVNEEGLINGMKFNFRAGRSVFLFGPVVYVGLSGEEFGSLNLDEQCPYGNDMLCVVKVYNGDGKLLECQSIRGFEKGISKMRSMHQESPGLTHVCENPNTGEIVEMRSCDFVDPDEAWYWADDEEDLMSGDLEDQLNALFGGGEGAEV